MISPGLQPLGLFLVTNTEDIIVSSCPSRAVSVLGADPLDVSLFSSVRRPLLG